MERQAKVELGKSRHGKPAHSVIRKLLWRRGQKQGKERAREKQGQQWPGRRGTKRGDVPAAQDGRDNGDTQDEPLTYAKESVGSMVASARDGGGECENWNV